MSGGCCPWSERPWPTAQSDRDSIDGVAYTAGPGLIGALLVGSGFATALGAAWGKPALGIHHLEGHLLAPLLEPDRRPFPFWRCWCPAAIPSSWMWRRWAATGFWARPWTMPPGEAFDKTAKLLGCPIRAARHWPRLAEHGRSGCFVFPRPMLDRPGLDFSFSGLKTAALVALRGRDIGRRDPSRRCARFPGSRGRYVWPRSAGARSRRQAIGAWSSPAASARIVACANGWPRWCGLGCGIVFSAHGILHGQRGNDCTGGMHAVGGRHARRTWE